MKKNKILRLGLLALALTLVTASLVSGTFAKYVTQATGTGTVTVAQWEATLTQGTTTLGSASSTESVTFDLFHNGNDTGVSADTLIAPGTSGTFSFSYKTNNSQVARSINVTMDVSSLITATNPLGYLKFYTSSAKTTELVPASGVITLVNKSVGPSSTDGDGEIPVYWEWPEGNTSAAADPQNLADTADGITPIKNANVILTFTATQLNTYTAP